MAFLESVREGLKKAAKGGWEAAKGGAKVAAEKGKKVATIEKLRYDAFITHRKAEKLFGELGGAVYELSKPPYENPLSKSEVTKIIEDIRGLEEKAAEVEAEIGKIKTASK
ncbi:MAG: hypothetical protein HY883_01955 [Deltaproteobacteria bacterium]|nr:hypothetical protein [Deltaproteobacteria bacterium]